MRRRIPRGHPETALLLAIAYALLLTIIGNSLGGPNVRPGDDLQAALNNGNVWLAPGVYTLNASVKSPNGRTLEGDPGAILKSNVPDALIANDTLGVTIRGITFDGGTLRASRANRLKVNGCTFLNQKTGTSCGFYAYGLTDSDVSGNTFRNVGFGPDERRCIAVWEAYRCHFDRNTATDCVSFIHAQWSGDHKSDPTDCTVLNNIITGGYTWHPIELQGSPNGLDVAFNWIGKLKPNPNLMGISCATGGDPHVLRDPTNPRSHPKGPYDAPPNTAYNVRIHHNVIDGDGLGTAGNPSWFAAIEIMGDGVDCYENYLAGFGQAFLVGINTDRVRIRSNRLRDFTAMSWGTGWSKMINPEDEFHALAAGNDAGNVFTTDPTPPVPTTQATTQPSDLAPNNVTVALLKDDPDYVAVTWSNRATVIATRIDVVSTKGREKLKATEILGGAQIAKVLVHQGWELDFTVTSRTAAGEFTSAPIVGVLTAGRGDAPYPPVPVTQPTTKPTADELALREQIKNGGEVVIPAGKTIETHETLLLPNYLELRGTGARLNYTGDPNKPAVSYSAAYPMRTTIKGLTIKSTGRGIALEREGSHLQILDVEIDSDREPIYFVPALDPNGKPTQMVYSPTIDHLIVTNPRAETHLRVRMATLSHLMFQFGGATAFRGDALLKLDGDSSQGSLDCLWDEPAFAIDQVKIGQPGTNLAHWDVTVPWYEPNRGGARVNATNAVIHTPYAYAQLGSPWVLRSSTVYASEVTAIGALGESIDPKTVFQGDASSVLFLRGAAVPLGAIQPVPATRPSN